MVKKSSNKEDENLKQEEKANEKNSPTEFKSEETKSAKKKASKNKESSKEKELSEKVDELNDKYLRLYSEFDNYRRRTAKERIELSKTASEEVIVELLPILDDFERAMKSTEEAAECDAVKEGIGLIYNKFKGTLEKKGLKAIEAIGKEFDTDFHEAITYIQAPSKKMKGKIVDEIEKGYMLQDKVIRYTKVVIGQ
jgi:molecular chaperone GrpE